MCVIHDNVSTQLFDFVNAHEIVKFDEKAEMYLWSFKGKEHKLAKEMVARVVNSIVDDWVDVQLVLDMQEFKSTLGMSHDDFGTWVQELVEEHLGGLLGVWTSWWRSVPRSGGDSKCGVWNLRHSQKVC